MANTLVGVYDNYSQAQGAYNELIARGFDRNDIQLSSESDSSDVTMQNSASSADYQDSESHGSGIGNFFRRLFGADDTYKEHADSYSEAVRRGHCVLAVDVDNDEESDQAVQIMNNFQPVDIDERAENWRSRGWAGYDTSSSQMSQDEIEDDRRYYTTGGSSIDSNVASSRDATNDIRTGGTTEGATIPVIQEELQVGKREVQRGGVRVYQRVKDTPVEEQVQLREEHVNVERRPVNQKATEADLAKIKEGSFELRESAEEAVVSKTARVVEEVNIGKETTERTETIRDNVRRTDVEVEQLGASSSGGDDEFRQHFQTTYGTSGNRYEDYAQAYRYGSTAAADDRYRGYHWDDAEPNVRQDWESRYGKASPWEKAKDAVRYGWEKATR